LSRAGRGRGAIIEGEHENETTELVRQVF
jgi:hypothetical protein